MIKFTNTIYKKNNPQDYNAYDLVILTKEKIDGSTVNKKKYLKKNMTTIVELNNG